VLWRDSPSFGGGWGEAKQEYSKCPKSKMSKKVTQAPLQENWVAGGEQSHQSFSNLSEPKLSGFMAIYEAGPQSDFGRAVFFKKKMMGHASTIHVY